MAASRRVPTRRAAGRGDSATSSRQRQPERLGLASTVATATPLGKSGEQRSVTSSAVDITGDDAQSRRNEDPRHRRRPGRYDDHRGARQRALDHRRRHRRGQAERPLLSLRRPDDGGKRRQPARPPGGGDRGHRSRHRLHLARRGQHRGGHPGRAARAGRANDRPDAERRVPRGVAGAAARRRLRRLLRARDRERDRSAHRHAGRAADRRLRRGPGAHGRVRRPEGLADRADDRSEVAGRGHSGRTRRWRASSGAIG